MAAKEGTIEDTNSKHPDGEQNKILLHGVVFRDL
jgi:hypothetical protein